MGRDWVVHAACRDLGDMFYPVRIDQAGVPLHICRHHCPVVGDCLDWVKPAVTVGMVAGGEHWVTDHRPGMAKSVKARSRTLPRSDGCPICEVGR